MSKEEEKKVLRDIDFLKKSVPHAERLEQIRPVMNDLFDKKRELGKQIKEVKDQIALKKEEIDKIRSDMNDAKEQKEETKHQLDKLDTEINTQYDTLNKIYESKREAKEEYYKAKLEYEIEQN